MTDLAGGQAALADLSLALVYASIACLLLAGLAFATYVARGAGPVRPADPRDLGYRAGGVGIALTWAGMAVLAAGLLTRSLSAGRAPWGNMYEFALAGAAAGLAAYLIAASRRDVRWLGLWVVVPVTLLLGLAVSVLYTESGPLVPALHSAWLVIHVSAAIIAFGAFTVGAAAALLALIAERGRPSLAVELARPPVPAGVADAAIGSAAALADRDLGPAGDDGLRVGRTPSRWLAARLPSPESLDSLSYRFTAFAFPIWTFAVIAGAIWAESAWGRYWGWDPKETWSLIIWVIYAGYLHARVTAGWGGSRAAVLNLLGYTAILFNFFGVNILIPGLHSYSGL